MRSLSIAILAATTCVALVSSQDRRPGSVNDYPTRPRPAVAHDPANDVEADIQATVEEVNLEVEKGELTVRLSFMDLFSLLLPSLLASSNEVGGNEDV